jgi:hypothetical protein
MREAITTAGRKKSPIGPYQNKKLKPSHITPMEEQGGEEV